MSKQWDFFLCHASEDKEIAREIVERLSALGYTVWFDEAVLRVGDSLREKIDAGLAQCRYGIVLLSPSFFAKNWPHMELDGLVARQAQGAKVVLPVYHNIMHEEVSQYSPLLSALLAAETSAGSSEVVRLLCQALPSDRPVLGVEGGCPSCRKGQLMLSDMFSGVSAEGCWNQYSCTHCGWTCRDYEVYGEDWFFHVYPNRALHKKGLL